MANPELLALLTAHGIDPAKVHGGTPSITQMDVAGMMARLTDWESALLRTKYCLEDMSEAWAYWFEQLMARGWSEGDGRVERLATLTLGDYAREQKCRACRGVCSIEHNNKVIVCEDCGGIGHVPRTDRTIARALDLATLRDPWKGRYGWCMRKLARVEADAIAKMRH